MKEQKKTLLNIDNVEYIYEEMTINQQTIINHIADLDQKIGTTRFNLDQLEVGKTAFVQLLKNTLNSSVESPV